MDSCPTYSLVIRRICSILAEWTLKFSGLQGTFRYSPRWIHSRRMPHFHLLLACFFSRTTNCWHSSQIILYLSYFYKHHELSIRLGFFWTAMSLSDTLAAFLAFGLLHMRGVHHYAGWRWLFLIEVRSLSVYCNRLPLTCHSGGNDSHYRYCRIYSYAG